MRTITVPRYVIYEIVGGNVIVGRDVVKKLERKHVAMAKVKCDDLWSVVWELSQYAENYVGKNFHIGVMLSRYSSMSWARHVEFPNVGVPYVEFV